MATMIFPSFPIVKERGPDSEPACSCRSKGLSLGLSQGAVMGLSGKTDFCT